MASSGWSKSPIRFAREAEQELNKHLRGSALDILGSVIERSPVRHGRFRGNHMVSVGTPETEYDESRLDPSGQVTLARGSAVIAGVNSPFSIIYIQNNLPYSEFLEAGNSNQAPAGVYEVTINSIQEFL